MKISRHWLWLLFVPVVWLGLSRLRLGTDVLDLLPPNLTAVQGLKLYQQHFANARELILTIKAQSAATDRLRSPVGGRRLGWRGGDRRWQRRGIRRGV